MSTQTRPRELSRSPLTLEDLTADLIWPRLLRAASLAINPSRMTIAFVAVLLLMLIGRTAGEIEEWRHADASDSIRLGEIAASAVGGLFGAVAQGEFGTLPRALYFAFIGAPAMALRESPVATIIAVVLGGLTVIIAGGAISRMAACEFSLGLSVGVSRGLGFALSRLGSLAGAIAGPFVVVWILALLVAVGGLLLRVPVLNVSAAVFFGIALLLGLIAVLVMIAFAVGKALLIPAVTCEGADAIDAIQRAYAYVLGRPLRFAVYALVLLLQGAVVLFFAWLIAEGTVVFAMESAAALAGDGGRAILARIDAPETQTAAALGSGGAAAAWLIRLWISLVDALLTAYALSFFYCASTLLYLAMRRVADGQDMHELWLPGMIRGTMAEESDAAMTPPTGGPEGGLIE